MTPIEAAVKVGQQRGVSGLASTRVDPYALFNADDARAIITAFLEAAAEDEETAHRVADAHIDAFETLDREHMGKAAILALKEAVE